LSYQAINPKLGKQTYNAWQALGMH